MVSTRDSYNLQLTNKAFSDFGYKFHKGRIESSIPVNEQYKSFFPCFLVANLSSTKYSVVINALKGFLPVFQPSHFLEAFHIIPTFHFPKHPKSAFYAYE